MATVEESGVDRYFVGGGAEHTQESMRRALCASTGGAEGIGGVSDLFVRHLVIPGAGVRIGTGTALIRSRFQNASMETYQCAVFREQQLEITPNQTDKDRYDLIVMRVEDGFAQNSTWPKPAAGEIANEQYIYARVIEGVSASVTRLQQVAGQANTTGYALARVKVPKMNATPSEIVDLRKVARPRKDYFVFARPRIAADETSGQQFLNGLVANGGEFFPGGAGSPNQFEVDIPEWATRMVIDAAWMTVYAGKLNPHGRFWIEYGDELRNHTWPNKQQYEFATQPFGFNYPNTTDEKTTNFLLSDEVPIPAKLRGKRVTFVFKAGLDKSFGANPLWMIWNGGLKCRLDFAEVASGPDAI